MNKKGYNSPSTEVLSILEERPVATSNVLSEDGVIDLNPQTMTGGNGSDAGAKRNGYDVWDEDWSR